MSNFQINDYVHINNYNERVAEELLKRGCKYSFWDIFKFLTKLSISCTIDFFCEEYETVPISFAKLDYDEYNNVIRKTFNIDFKGVDTSESSYEEVCRVLYR